MEGVGASYAIVQHSPSYMRVVAAHSGHGRTQRTTRYVEIIMHNRRKYMARGGGGLNPIRWLWCHARWHLLYQSDH
jgi:hypothetical protein